MPNACKALAAIVCCTLAMAVCAGLPSAEARPALIDERESVYNNIYVFREGPFITMTFGHNRALYTETVYDVRDELALPVRYTRYMTAVLAYADRVDRLLEIGFGGGRTAWYLHKTMPELEIVSVELDKEVFELAERHFGVRTEPKFHVSIEDGRRYLQGRDTRWPIIMIDAYRGPFVPFHLLTTEFYELVRSRLAPGGAVAQNVEPTTMMFDAALATIGGVFENVDLYDAGGNVVMIAYDGPKRDRAGLLTAAARLDARYRFKYPLIELVARRRPVESLPDMRPMTDDFAPVESLRAIERHNTKLDAFVEGKR